MGVGKLNRSGHLTGIGTYDANGKPNKDTKVNPNQKNKARNKDGTYSVDSDGNGAGDAGGTVICTELHAQGLLPHDVYRADQRFGFRMMRDDPYVIAGYHLWAKPVVKLMRKSKLFTHILNTTLAEAWAKEMVVREGLNGVGTLRGRVLFAIGLPVCRAIGRMLEAYNRREGRAA